MWKPNKESLKHSKLPYNNFPFYRLLDIPLVNLIYPLNVIYLFLSYIVEKIFKHEQKDCNYGREKPKVAVSLYIWSS
jgi:hypothetical protein